MRPTLLLLLSLPLAAFAQDGGQLYTQYCSACHAPDGKGATGGQFPPLADSDWVAGKPDRAIKSVLHGLEGPVEVNGKTYNLLMPPQGAVLSDENLAAILTYVRSSWGNKGDAVKPETVKAIRAATADRDKPWTAAELLKDHPLPKAPSRLKDLTTKVYKGKWDKFPDFASLTPEAIEEEQEGLVSLKKINYDNHFGVVWEGTLIAPKNGDFTFGLDSDDESRLYIGDKKVVEVTDAGPMGRTREGRVLLQEGPNPFRLEYREIEGGQDVSLYMKGGGMKQEFLSTTRGKSGSGKNWPSIPLVPTAERAAIYRNFIAGTTPRAIGIGLPGGVNFAYSADHLAPELIWRGAFMDAGRHWTNRGQGAEPPAGEQLLKLTSDPAMGESAGFGGYKLDPSGNPTFIVSTGDSTIQDSFSRSGTALVREIRSQGDSPVTILLSQKNPVEADGGGAWMIDGRLQIAVTGASAKLEGDQLMLELPANGTATLTHTWK